MTDAEKLKGWFDQLGEEGMRVSSRWLKAVDMLAAGAYEPKHALSDWYFVMSRWLAFLPQAPTAAGLAPPLVLLSVHAGQDTAAATLDIPPAKTAAINADLVTSDSTKTIAKGKLTTVLHDGGATLLVTATGLKGLGLSVGDTYSGKVMDGTTLIANVAIEVL